MLTVIMNDWNEFIEELRELIKEPNVLRVTVRHAVMPTGKHHGESDEYAFFVSFCTEESLIRYEERGVRKNMETVQRKRMKGFRGFKIRVRNGYYTLQGAQDAR